MVSHSAPPKAAPDSTPAATRSRGDRIAIEDHTLGVPEKRHTEFHAAAVASDRNQLVAHSHLAGHSRVAGRKLKEDRRPADGRTHLTGYSQVTGYS